MMDQAHARSTYNAARFMHEKLNTDLEFFCKHCLKIKPKEGDIHPFTLNRAQKYLHYRLEQQLARTGRVRALILKGRQQGCSTYVAARYYHKATRHKGKSVYILSHEASTTTKLFNIVKRYHEYMPEPAKPGTVKDNEKSIIFSLNSEYSIGTAGNKNTGRGGTVQLFHGSEVGFYENTEELQTGLLQSIADLPNTEIILESTANGMGNYFHQMCMGALKGENEYELIFIPWYWQPEYTKEPPSDFEPTDEEKKLIESYKLSHAQLYWRRMKIASLVGGEWKFKQEYPNNIQEAFQTSGSSMISAEDIMAARKRPQYPNEHAPLIGACDTARSGDRIPRMFRQGRNLLGYEVHDPKKDGILKTMQLAGLIAKDIVERNIDAYFVDCTNGWGVVDVLHDMGFKGIVRGIVFSETKSLLEPQRFVNKRSEMLVAVRDWFEADDPSIPDEDELHVDIAAIPEPKETAASKLFIVPKDKIKEILGMSPDLMDTLALTFAFPVHYNKNGNTIRKKEVSTITRKTSSLKTFRRASRYGKSEDNSVRSINLFE